MRVTRVRSFYIREGNHAQARSFCFECNLTREEKHYVLRNLGYCVECTYSCDTQSIAVYIHVVLEIP